MLLGIGFSSLGGGLALALFVVYLHKVRGIPLQTAGLVLAYQALLGLLFSPVVGCGGRPHRPAAGAAGGVLIEAVGSAGVRLRHDVPAGVRRRRRSWRSATPASGRRRRRILSRLAPPEHRQRVFGLQFMLLNLGLGLGGLLGAAILDVDNPQTFTALYAVNAVSFLFYFVAVAGVRGVSGPEVHEADADDDGPGGYREVLGDRRLRRYVARCAAAAHAAATARWTPASRRS